MDYAENLTLPVGPAEEQSWFWATSRLGISTLGIYARYDLGGQTHRRFFHYLSQILDHTALHASEALKDVIARINLDSFCMQSSSLDGLRASLQSIRVPCHSCTLIDDCRPDMEDCEL